MAGDHTITATGFRRPWLFARMLRTLRANDLAGWRIALQIEPSFASREFVAAAEEILSGCDFSIRVNAKRLGVRFNPFTLIDRVFEEGGALNICLEEDLLLSPDICDLALWYARNHQPHWLCLNLLSGGCGSAGFISNPAYPRTLFESRLLNSLGLVVRRNEWHAHMRAAWADESVVTRDYQGREMRGWDWSLGALLLRSPSLRSLHVALARATHSGAELGEYCSKQFHDLAFGDLPIAGPDTVDADAGGRREPDDRYRIMASHELPADLRRHVILADEMALALAALDRAGDGAAPPGVSPRRKSWLGRLGARPRGGK